MVFFVVRRLLMGVVVVFVVACFAYGGWRFLRREVPANQPWFDLSVEDLKAFFLHRDFGEACSFLEGAKSRPCPSIRDLFNRGWQADVWLIAGAIGLGTFSGMVGGLWCAVRPRAIRTRVLEILAMLGLCAPPFVFGYGLLLLFEPTFGHFKLPLLFDVHVYEPPYENPWNFLRGMLVPWIVAGAPVFAIVLRITRSAVVESLDEDFMRTAVAKGLSPAKVIFRHGRPLADAAVFSWVGTSAALIVTNVLITETVFSVPGFLYHTQRAFKPPAQPEAPDHVLLQAEGVWVAILVVALVILSDLLVMARDPRVRTSTA